MASSHTLPFVGRVVTRAGSASTLCLKRNNTGAGDINKHKYAVFFGIFILLSNFIKERFTLSRKINLNGVVSCSTGNERCIFFIRLFFDWT